MVESIFISVVSSNSWRSSSNRCVGRNNCLDLIVGSVLDFTVDDRIFMKFFLIGLICGAELVIWIDTET